MITVTKKEFTDWIKAQPDDKPMDIGGSHSEAECGCPMVQYANEMFPKEVLPEKWGCGFARWVPESSPDAKAFASFEKGKVIDSFIKDGIFNRSKTFGALKKSLK